MYFELKHTVLCFFPFNIDLYKNVIIDYQRMQIDDIPFRIVLHTRLCVSLFAIIVKSDLLNSASLVLLFCIFNARRSGSSRWSIALFVIYLDTV
jgi:hypothetical protein